MEIALFCLSYSSLSMEPIVSYKNQRRKFVWPINLSGLRFISVDVNLSIAGRERVWMRVGGAGGGGGRKEKARREKEPYQPMTHFKHAIYLK